MAIFDDKLKPEEELSGFTVEEVDNDVFTLNTFDTDYPGKVPEFNETTFLNSKTKSIIGTSKIKATPNEVRVNPTKNIVKEQPIVEPIAPPVTEPIVTEPIVPPIAEPITPPVVEPIVPPVAEQEPQETFENSEGYEIDEVEDDIKIANTKIPERVTSDKVENVSFDDIFNVLDDNSSENQISSNSDAAVTESSEVIILDDDFRRQLLSDINSQNIKKPETDQDATIEEIEQYEEDVIQFQTTGSSVNELIADSSTDVVNADLISMEFQTIKGQKETAEKPQEKEEENENKNNQQDVKATKDIDNNPKNDDVDITNEEKPMEEEIIKEPKNKQKSLTLIVAIVTLIAIVIVGAVIGYLYLSNKSNIKKDEPIVADTNKVKTTEVKKEIIKVDTIKTDTAKTDTVKLDTNLNTEKEPKEVQQKVVEPKQIEKTVKPKVVAQSNYNIGTIKRSNKPIVEKSSAKTTNEVYTVQIYSSPSKSDAEIRLNMLKQKNINGIISIQNIKGNTWYRVRFGQYDTYEAALSAVNKYGLENVWIERVK